MERESCNVLHNRKTAGIIKQSQCKKYEHANATAMPQTLFPSPALPCPIPHLLETMNPLCGSFRYPLQLHQSRHGRKPKDAGMMRGNFRLPLGQVYGLPKDVLFAAFV
jgi:hypothetical protein